MSLAAQIVEIATKTGATITTAESCTGGMVAAAITDIPGSSNALERGLVTYSNAAKIEMLGVKPATLKAHGAVSEEIAAEMAEGALRHSHARIAVAITGIAGPGSSEFKPEGRVCFGLAGAGPTATETIEFGARGRDHVRAAARDHALDLLLAALRSATS